MSEPPKDDDRLSALMRGLPEQPLPPGFMQRLERRRRAEAGPQPRTTKYLLPFPVRVAAFACSSLIVSLFIYDKVKVMFPSGEILAGDAGQTADVLPSAKLSEADVERARAEGTGRRLLRAKGEPLDTPQGAELLRNAEARQAVLARQPTNEELQAGLELEKKKLGVRRIEPPPPPEIQAQMRLQAGVNARMLHTSPPPPVLGATGTPALLAAADAGASVGAGGSSTPGSADKPLPREKGAPVMEMALAAPASVPAVPAAAASPAAPTSPAEAATAAEGLVVRSADERVKAWSLHGLRAAPPSVDFKLNMIALVLAPDLRTAVEIIGVSTGADAVTVQYRLLPRSGAAGVRAYQYRVIPRSDKPVVFQKAD